MSLEFIWLLFGHYIGDIALQSEWQANNKAKYWYVMLCHCMVYTSIISIAMKYIGIFEWYKVAFIFAGHFACDSIKSRQPKEVTKRVAVHSRGLLGRIFTGDYWTHYETRTVSNWWMIYPDQAWHIAQLILIFLIK